MRAIAITRPGGVDVLEVADLPAREPAQGEIRIAVKAAAVNPIDIKMRQHGEGLVLPPPWILGMDAAGVVESVGPGVNRVQVGQEVMATVTPRRPEGGAQQELLVVPSTSAVPTPDGASLTEAATLPMNGLTALAGLDLLGLRSGETLAVSGAAGLLGSYVIALAKERGLRVIGDATREDEELVKDFGADIVVPRSEVFGDAIRAVARDGIDAVFDTARLCCDAFPAIRDGGQIVLVRGWDGAEVEDRGVRVHPVLVDRVLERTDWLDELRLLASAGRLKLRVALEIPLERAAEAHRLMEVGGLRGRVVVVF